MDIGQLLACHFLLGRVDFVAVVTHSEILPKLAGGAGRARLVVMILFMVGNPLVVREPCEIVVFGGLEVGGRGCDGPCSAMAQGFCALN